MIKIFQKPINFIMEVKAELGKVAWSTRQELMASTVVVIVTVALLGAFIFVIDAGLSKGLSVLLK
jgi:preprotein translocase subunit SecE